MLQRKELSNEVYAAVEETAVVDIHTHLFPPQATGYFSSGLISLLTYHYLVSEYLLVSAKPPQEFDKFNPRIKAEKIWGALFLERSPLSEATLGVITVLSELGITYERQSFSQLLTTYDLKTSKNDPDDYLKKAKVSHVVMTNNPFDREEYKAVVENKFDRNVYLASLRVDDLFYRKKHALEVVCSQSDQHAATPSEKLTSFLTDTANTLKARYVGLSGSYEEVREILEHDEHLPVLMNTLRKNQLPLALFIGVRRGINPELGPSGDGVARGDISWLPEVLQKYHDIQFLITCLSYDQQYQLTVLAQKFANAKLFGCWWYLNNRSCFTTIAKMRMDLLGSHFIPQFSDARVLEQLIYKWKHFREAIAPILEERYLLLSNRGALISREIIRRDVSNYFNQLCASTLNLNLPGIGTR